MVIDTVFGFKSSSKRTETAASEVLARLFNAVGNKLAQFWCGMHGHLIMLHFAPNKLSLQCALCQYETEGWDVGRPLIARRPVEHRVHTHKVHTERRSQLRAVPPP